MNRLSLTLVSPVVIALASVVPAESQAQQWVECASQGQVCKLDGVGILRYGVNNRWYYAVATGSYRCDEKVLGDPAVGVQKTCQRWEAPEETARAQELASTRAQLEKAQEAISETEAQGRYIAQLEREIAETREEMRELRRALRRATR